MLPARFARVTARGFAGAASEPSSARECALGRCSTSDRRGADCDGVGPSSMRGGALRAKRARDREYVGGNVSERRESVAWRRYFVVPSLSLKRCREKRSEQPLDAQRTGSRDLRQPYRAAWRWRGRWDTASRLSAWRSFILQWPRERRRAFLKTYSAPLAQRKPPRLRREARRNAARISEAAGEAMTFTRKQERSLAAAGPSMRSRASGPQSPRGLRAGGPSMRKRAGTATRFSPSPKTGPARSPNSVRWETTELKSPTRPRRSCTTRRCDEATS